MNHATWVMSVNFDTLYDDYDTTENTSKGFEASAETNPGVRSSTPSVTSTERKVTSMMGRESRRRGQVGRTAGARRFTKTDTGKFKIFLSTML